MAAPAAPLSASGSRQSKGKQQQQEFSQGRAYALTQGEEVEHAVLKGNILISNTWASALFDTGASHSFLATSFASSVGLQVEALEVPFSIYSPVGSSSSVQWVARNCKVEIAGVRFDFNMILFDMDEFDAILGVDWLSTFRATIDVYRRRVEFQLEDGEFVSLGQ